jgi:hypothetical protein
VTATHQEHAAAVTAKSVIETKQAATRYDSNCYRPCKDKLRLRAPTINCCTHVKVVQHSPCTDTHSTSCKSFHGHPISSRLPQHKTYQLLMPFAASSARAHSPIVISAIAAAAGHSRQAPAAAAAVVAPAACLVDRRSPGAFPVASREGGHHTLQAAHHSNASSDPNIQETTMTNHSSTQLRHGWRVATMSCKQHIKAARVLICSIEHTYMTQQQKSTQTHNSAGIAAGWPP